MQEPQDVNVKAGDVLLIWNYPHPIASFLIQIFSGTHCDHCATVLPDNNELMVYEAHPPASRKMTVAEYRNLMWEWSKGLMWWRNWRERYLYCEVWRPPTITQEKIQAMHAEAERWLGVPYEMVWNYLFSTEKTHCSEECGRILQAGGYVDWDKEPSKIEPMDVRTIMKNTGWAHVGDITYGN